MKTSLSFISRLKQEEGFSASPYWDRTHWTWGYGTRAPGQYGTITPEQAEDELLTHVSMAEGNYLIVFQADPPGITQARYDSIVDMLYNLGLGGFSAFTYTLAAIRAGEWEKAAAHAQQSLWHKQVGGRARRVVKEFRTGVSIAPETGEVAVNQESGADNQGKVEPPAPSQAVSWWAGLLDMFGKLFKGGKA
jgi:GH24 family phage-related lysozyme (muramidase)